MTRRGSIIFSFPGTSELDESAANKVYSYYRYLSTGSGGTKDLVRRALASMSRISMS